ncbi:uncharacterized protein AAES06_018261 [Glossophaga mutica]
MAGRNSSVVTEFILLGLTDSPELNTVLFVLFLVIYLITAAGNGWVMALILASAQLHSPKYFFLCQLAFLDFCYSSVFIPKMLVNYMTGQTVISYLGCLLQYSFVSMLLTTECFLLAAMAYDRYVAICHPLHYRGLMTPTLCIYLVAASYLLGCANSLTHLRSLLSLSFCGPNVINHYFCDIPLLFQLSCSDTQYSEVLFSVLSGATSVTTFLMVVSSYLGILRTVLKAHSTRNIHKAFSTCASHLTVVTLFYGTVIFTYLGTSSRYQQDRAKILSVFYTLLLPILNLLIYSVRNTEAKEAMARVIMRKIFARFQEKNHMADVNFTIVTEFMLLGLTDRAELKVFLFVLFMLIYMISLVGNLGMLFLIYTTPKLQTPMYHFLSCMSFVDACCSSLFAPQMLLNFFVEWNTISYSACIVQFFFLASLLTTEGLLLAAMAYDRYMAIVNPLLYTVAMTKIVCVALVIGSCVGGVINSLTHTIGLLKLSFCGPNVIHHFFCDLPPLLKLSCSDTSMNELLLLIFTGVIAIITFLTVMISYVFIVAAILRIRSAAGRQRAFSTCASHLTAVTLFYGSVSFSYIQPSSQYSLEQEKVVSVFYTLVIPMLNPLIYSLRNKEVKDAVKRAVEMKCVPC